MDRQPDPRTHTLRTTYQPRDRDHWSAQRGLIRQEFVAEDFRVPRRVLVLRELRRCLLFQRRHLRHPVRESSVDAAVLRPSAITRSCFQIAVGAFFLSTFLVSVTVFAIWR